jgi:hypothetical protein
MNTHKEVTKEEKKITPHISNKKEKKVTLGYTTFSSKHLYSLTTPSSSRRHIVFSGELRSG